MTQTMRERLIAAAGNAPRVVGHESHMKAVVDAILSELSGEGSAMLRAGGEAVQTHLGQDESGQWVPAADCALIAALAFTAMIDHVRAGR